MQTIVRCFALLAVIAGALDTSSAQDAATAISEIGTNAVNIAGTTSSVASSLASVLSRINPVSGQLLESVQQIKSQADANAYADNQLNAKLQSLLDSVNADFSDTENNNAGVFNGIRHLRTGDN